MESVCIAPIRTELSQTSIVTVVQLLSLFHSLRPHGLQPSRLPCPGILQARVLEWVTISFSRGSSRPGEPHDPGTKPTSLEPASGFFTAELPVQFSSVTQSPLTLGDPLLCCMPGFPVNHQIRKLLRIMLIESVMLSNHLILCLSLLLPSIS